MAYVVEVVVSSAKDLKNVNWRHGRTRPYAVVWVDPQNKQSTRVDEEGDTSPFWDQSLSIPVSGRVEDATLHLDVVHAGAEKDTKKLIGSTRLHLVEVIDDVGIGELSQRTLHLKRPSGRPHGKVEVKVCIKDSRYRTQDRNYAPPYGVPPPPTSRGYAAPPPYDGPPPYGVPPPPTSRDYAAPPSYGGPPPYGAPPPPTFRDYPTPPPYAGQPPYGAPPPPSSRDYPAPPPYADPYSAASRGAPYYSSGYPDSSYAQQSYGQPTGYYGQPSYGQGQYGYSEYGQGQQQKSSKFGMGTGLAVGAVGGVLGGLALAEGIDYVEDKIANDAAERVEDNLGYDGDDF